MTQCARVVRAGADHIRYMLIKISTRGPAWELCVKMTCFAASSVAVFQSKCNISVAKTTDVLSYLIYDTIIACDTFCEQIVL